MILPDGVSSVGDIHFLVQVDSAALTERRIANNDHHGHRKTWQPWRVSLGMKRT